MNIICKIITGSNLYHLNTPTSDVDVHGIYLPEIKYLLLQRVSNSVQLNSNNDGNIFSLQYFMKLLCEGQSIAIEMVSAPENKWLEFSELWRSIHNNRKLFYTKNMKAFIGYARQMSSRWNVRADRMQFIENIINVLKEQNIYAKLGTIWDLLSENEFITKGETTRNNNFDRRIINILGREISAAVSIEYAINILNNIKSN